MRLSPDGSRLFVTNTAAGRLSVFSLQSPAQPTLIAEIPVGIGPVAVWPLSNDEAWVVNHVSGTVSVVSVSRGIVVETLAAGLEPSDIILAGNPARIYVSASGDRALRIYEPVTRALLQVVALQGEYPRSLAATADGSMVFVVFALGGNGTTIMPLRVNPPSPEHDMVIDGLPPAPGVGMIIDADDASLNGFMDYTLADHDVAALITDTGALHYLEGLGTSNFAVALSPDGGHLYVANTEAHNLLFFLSNLRGQFVSNRLTRVSLSNGEQTVLGLDPQADLSVLPDVSARAAALAQPAALVFHPTGEFLWVASFGSDRLARVSPDGVVQEMIDLLPTAAGMADPENKRGPRGLALSSDGNWLYVMNRISNTLATVDTQASALVHEMPTGSYDPEPDFIRQGRGFLYDARLSGTGAQSCASCHVDGGTDNLAWNMGDPAGSMKYIKDPVTGEDFALHPLKGPLVTQPLSGLNGQQAFHWRGDLPSLSSFNELFDKVMGAPELPAESIQKLSDFMGSIAMHANPNLKLDGSFADSLGGFSPELGVQSFDSQTCTSCHSLPGESAAPKYIQRPNGSTLMVASLRRFYRKDGYRNTPGAVSTIGFGVLKDGAEATELSSDMFAFMFSWDTGTAPTVGHTVSLYQAVADDTSRLTRWQTLEQRASLGANDLLLHGADETGRIGYLYDPVNAVYLDCQDLTRTVSRESLLNAVREGGTSLSVLGMPPGFASCGHLQGVIP